MLILYNPFRATLTQQKTTKHDPWKRVDPIGLKKSSFQYNAIQILNKTDTRSHHAKHKTKHQNAQVVCKNNAVLWEND